MYVLSIYVCLYMSCYKSCINQPKRYAQPIIFFSNNKISCFYLVVTIVKIKFMELSPSGIKEN